MSLEPVSDGEASAVAADLATGAWRGCGEAVDPAAAVAVAATSDAAPTNAVTQNAELRRTAIPIAGDLSATRHDRPPPLSDCGRRCVPAPANGLVSSYTFQTKSSRGTRKSDRSFASPSARRMGAGVNIEWKRLPTDPSHSATQYVLFGWLRSVVRRGRSPLHYPDPTGSTGGLMTGSLVPVTGVSAR